MSKRGSQDSIKSYLQSTWTPLGNEETNNKVFEDRKQLILKWWDKWSDDQKTALMTDLLARSKPSILRQISGLVESKAGVEHMDFTRILPRVVTLYIFSFLDPRSLCRSSQVCWYWKHLADSNEIWAPKCARLGWYNSGPIGSLSVEQWKQHYLDNINFLQVVKPNQDLAISEMLKEKEEIERIKQERLAAESCRNSRSRKSMPWRGPDRDPKDIHRNNYLKNESTDKLNKSMRNKSDISGRPSSAASNRSVRHRSGSASGRQGSQSSRTAVSSGRRSSPPASHTFNHHGNKNTGPPSNQVSFQGNATYPPLPPSYDGYHQPLTEHHRPPPSHTTLDTASVTISNGPGSVCAEGRPPIASHMKRPEPVHRLFESKKQNSERDKENEEFLPPGKPWIPSN